MPPDDQTRSLRTLVADEQGFTLVEVTVTAAIATVILLAIVMTADIFGSTVSRADRLSDTQEQARSAVREMVRQLRDARVPAGAGQTTPLASSPLPSRTNIVFAARLQQTDAVDAQPGWVRYCTTTTSGTGDLLAGRLLGTVFAAPGACGTAASGWTYRRLLRGGLTDTSRVFDFSTAASTNPATNVVTPACVGAGCAPTTAAAVANVTVIGIGLSIEAKAGGSAAASRPYVARDAVALRNLKPTP